MTEKFDHDDLAYGIVEDLLDDGVEYLTIAEAVADTGGTEDDVGPTWHAVRGLLVNMRSALQDSREDDQR